MNSELHSLLRLCCVVFHKTMPSSVDWQHALVFAMPPVHGATVSKSYNTKTEQEEGTEQREREREAEKARGSGKARKGLKKY